MPVFIFSALLMFIIAGLAYTQVLLAQPIDKGLARPEWLQQQEQQLYLLLIINKLSTGRIVPIKRQGEHFYLRPVDVREFQLAGGLDAHQWLDLKTVDWLSIDYNQADQSLAVQVPPKKLKHNFLAPQQQQYVPAVSGTGALFNYDFYSYSAQNYGWQHSMWHEVRLFNPAGVFNSSGIFRYQSGRTRTARASRYLRYDTSLHINDQDSMRSYEIGDFISRTPSWASAVRMAGVQISRNFALRPDLVTYPLPSFSGQLAVPTTVDLFIDSTRIQTHNLPPGPFTMTDSPNVSGAGLATLSFRDAQGRPVTETLPFYVSNRLLKQGLDSYNFALGALRKNFGASSFDYERMASSLSYRRGITNWLTLGGHAELMQDLYLAGLGGTLKLGQLGVVEAAVRNSRVEGDNRRAYDLGYYYQRKGFNLNVQYQKQDYGFQSLTAMGRERLLATAPGSKNLQISTGLSLGGSGSLGAAYFYRRYYRPGLANTSKSGNAKVWNISYHKPIARGAFLGVSLNRQINQGWSAMLQLSLALPDSKGNITLANNRAVDGSNSQTAQLRRSPPIAGGWGWDLSYRRYQQQRNQYQTSISQRNSYNTWSAGVYRTQGHDEYFGELRGAVAVMDGQAFLTQDIRDTFAVVSTNGIGEVPVRYENQLVGKTNRQGYLLVPYGSAYYPGKYSIDPLALPADVFIPDTEQRVALKGQSGYLLRFGLQVQQPASFTVLTADGAVLPAGTRITIDNGIETYVGWDGMVYINDLRTTTMLHAYPRNKQKCMTWLKPVDNTITSGVIKPSVVVCH